jgi:drug/metabolite transporter (DMT)-like permease
VLLGLTALWGLTFVTVKDALALADTFTFLALRFGVGAVVALTLARRQLRVPGVARTGAFLGLFLFSGFALQTAGLETTTPSRSAFITGLCVLLVPFVSWGLSGRRPPVPALLGVALAAVGLQALTGATFGGAFPIGDVLTFFCAIAYAFHVSLTERLARGLPAVAMVGVQLAVVSLLSVAALPFVSRRLESGPALWGGVLATGVFASALAISLQTWAQARTTAVRASLIFSLEPVFAAAYSAAVGREQLGRPELVGGGLIVGGVLVAELGAALQNRRAIAPPPA